MKYRLAIILSVLLFSCSTLLKAQGNMDGTYNTLKIEPNKLKQDIDTLFLYLEDIHPELFEIHPKEKFQFTIDSIKSTIVEPLNAADFYLKLLPVFQLERDGHTFVNYPTTISDTLDQQGMKFFPFKVSFLKKKIYITENYTSNVIPEYAEIISINGVPTETIVSTFEKIESFDRYEALEPYMSYLFKHLLYPLFGWHNKFEIEYRVNGVLEKKAVSGISLKEYPTKPYEYFRFSIDSTKKFAILDLNLCEGYDRFPSFCDSVFSELKKQQIPNLIIDLRRNTGGTTRHGDTLVTYLTDKKFTQYPRTDFKRSKLLDNSLDSSFVEKFANDISIAHKNPNLYQGEIFVFIDVFTFSSATVLAGTIQCYDLGTVIGQESGGTQIMYSAFHELYLPNSDLFVGISRDKRFIPCGKERFRGVIPDYQINYSIQDLKLKKDLEMEIFMELITPKNKRH